MSKKMKKTVALCACLVASLLSVMLVSMWKSKADSKVFYDPISEEFLSKYDNALTIPELQDGQEDVQVIGQVVYAYASGSDGTASNFILQDVIDNEVVGVLVNDSINASKYSVNDVVVVTGSVSTYGEELQISDVKNVEVLKTEKEFKPQEVTISELKADADKYVSEYVLIKNVKLGKYEKEGNTIVSDGTGSLPIYRGAKYPDELKEGDRADIYTVFARFKGAAQLRLGASSNYIPCENVNENNYYSNTKIDIAKFSGKSVENASEINGDKYEAGDLKDNAAKISVSKGKTCALQGNAEGTYVLGAKGLKDTDYIQMAISTKKLGNLNMSFDIKGTQTAARYYTIQYSTDGSNFVNYTKIDVEVKDVSKTINLELPINLNNQEKVYIRIVPYNKSFDKTDIDGEGKVYLSKISVVGSPTKDSSVCSYVKVSPSDEKTVKNSELSLECDTKDAIIHYAINGGEYKVYDANNKPIIDSFPLYVSVYASKEGLENSVVVNKKYTQIQADKVKASPKSGAIRLDKVIKLSTETEDGTIMYSYDEKEWKEYSEGSIVASNLPLTVYVKTIKQGYLDSEVTKLEYTLKENKDYNVYFGQIHSHTNYSDGAGTCEEAYNHAANKAEQIDFLAVTDHSNSFDNADSANILDGTMSTEWNEGHALADKYTNRKFVGLFGYEMTWSNGLGHMNTFNTNGFQSRTQEEFKRFDTALQNYYGKLKADTDSISQFNHPGTTFGDFSDFAYYDEELDDLITIIEVGNGEGAIGSSGYFPSYEYYTRALDKGWHVAPTNNQDNHKGMWGNSNTGRTVVVAESLTRENIYDAMKNYRVYATEDNDLEIKYTLDDYFMGDRVEKEDVGNNVDINVNVKDPTDNVMGKVEVIVNGGLSIATENFDNASGDVKFNVPSDYSYYYIKVTQPDGDIAVTAPIWIGEVEAIGSNGISTSTSLCVAGEKIDVNYGMYNNEKNDFEVDSIEYSVDNKIIHKANLKKANFEKVPSMGEASYSFDYVHNKVGACQIKVEVKGKLNGVDKKYTDILKLNYISKDMVTDVLVDGTHHNDYVSGYYDGNMGNFTDMAAKKNVRVHVEKNKITKEMLDKAQFLVISAPAKKAGSTDAGAYEVEHYSKEFLGLIKEYVASGKTLMVCGLSDLLDTEEGQTSTEQNKLLEAIGATTRINSDQACDDVTNGGQPYRLYLDKFNSTNEVFKGIEEGQKYSQYKGCSLILDSTAVEQGKADWLVKGYDTTYSQDTTQFTKDRVDTSGNICTMAVEKLDSGSKVYISGAVCLSNFEVKANLDNAGDLQYANYTIVNNILDSIVKQMPITPIREVRKANMGDIFTIEGYVTSGTSDENCRFFDAIYVQDDTAGITVFPYAAEGLELGTKIQITGYVDAYQGDKEIQVMSYKIIDDKNKVIVKPTLMSVKDSMDYDNYGGMLIQTVGTATNIKYTEDGKGVSQFDIKDAEGNVSNIFIDGYILSSKTGKNELAGVVKEGQLVSAVGLLYKHPEGNSDVSVPCLRVRNCDEIVAVTQDQADKMREIINKGEYKKYAYTSYNDDNGTNNSDNNNSGNNNSGELSEDNKVPNAYDINDELSNNAKNDNGDTSIVAKLKDIVKTFDNNNIWPYVVMAVGALCLMIVIIVVKRRNDNKEG